MMVYSLICIVYIFIFAVIVHPPIIEATDNSFNSPIEQSNYRLNNDVIPKDYDIVLTVLKDFSETKLFFGVSKITVVLKAGIDSTDKEIKLHVKNITLDKAEEVKLYTQKNGNRNLLNNTFKPVPDDKFETITLKLQENVTLYEKANYIIRIKYTGSFQTNNNGFYLTSYENEKKEREWLVTTNLQPTHARKVFPCFDEPNLKANFNITVIHPREYQILGNSEIRMTVNNSNGIKTIFTQTLEIPTHTVGVALSKLASLSSFNEVMGLHTMWYFQRSIALTNYAFQLTPKIIKEISDTTGITYTSTASKLDQIVIPELTTDSMGNWALTSYRENLLPWHPADSTARDKQNSAINVARALSYIWFGNIVTIDWWSFAWLREGLVCYYSYFITSKVENTWRLEHQFIIDHHQRALANDIATSGEPLTSKENDVYTTGHIFNKFNVITYSKGGTIIRMIEQFMGNKYFTSGIREYIQASSFGSTKPEHLWEALHKNLDPTKTLPTDLASIMKTWTEQIGYPVVTAKIVGKDVHLSQARYYRGNTNNKDKTINQWYIPISYTTSEEKQFDSAIPRIWMEPINDTQTIKNIIQHNTSWIIMNIQNSAYIRVNYDQHIWEALEKALKSSEFNNIHVLNRVQLLDDAMNLARAGIISYEVALDLALYLQNEVEYYPWLSAFSVFEYLMIRLHEDAETTKLLNFYLLDLMQTFYASSQYLNSTDQITIYKNELAFKWACQLGSKECIEEAKAMFFANSHQRIEPNLRNTVYCTAMHYLENIANWIFLRNQLSEAKLPSQIEMIIKSLGCTTLETLLEQYLNESINPNSDIQKQYRKSILEAVILGNQANVPLAFSFLRNNLDEIIERYGGSYSISHAILLLAKRLNQEKYINEFKQFIFENKEKFKSLDHTIKVAIETCNENVYWNREYKEVIKDYLINRVKVPTTTSSALDKTSTTIITDNNGGGTAPTILLSTITITLHFVVIILNASLMTVVI